MTNLEEVLLFCLLYFKRNDEANSAIHCAHVRYSPITFRLTDALRDLGVKDHPLVIEVWAHKGNYLEDPGR